MITLNLMDVFVEGMRMFFTEKGSEQVGLLL